MGLTQKQRELLRFLCIYMDASEGVAPSFVEMMEAMGVASRSNIHRMLGELEYRGIIRRIPYRRRAIEILQRPDKLNDPLARASTSDVIAELVRRTLSADQCAELHCLLEREQPHD